MKRWRSITAAGIVATSGALAFAQQRVAPLPPLREPGRYARPAAYQADASTPPARLPSESLPPESPMPQPRSVEPPRDAPSPPDAPAPQAQLTLADAEAIALGNHPGLARASARVSAARGAWLQAGLLPNPTAGYMGEEMGDDDTAGMQGAFVGQEIVTAGKLRLSRAVAAQEIRRAEAELEAMRFRVTADVQSAFYDALVAQETIRMVADLVRIATDAVKTTETLFSQGEVSRVELLQARIEANTTQLLLDTTRNGHAAAVRRLEAQLGSVGPLGELAGDPRAGLPQIAWDEALGRLLAESPELAAAQAMVDKAGWAVDRARAERIPNVDAQVAVLHNNATQQDVASVGIGLPLPIFNRNQGGIQAARAELSAANSNVVRVEQDIKRRLAGTYERYDNARRRVDEYQHRILPDAKEALDLVEVGYRNGEFGYLTLLTTQRTYVETHLSFLDALRELREAAAIIDAMLLDGSLEDR
ncbi:MAG: hypothetical protein DCC68_02935 [Planctomycetota bacterium]|nr:MAG: hypothetical protein DCC68_02935 [Planctomycetota bacterium]